ncbi:MAG: DUF1501 domain-containing protein, partial [Acidimicrobiales bacterium]|nr:DUF1501 domain-containing protein [Acidimicrobiales bacterium]
MTEPNQNAHPDGPPAAGEDPGPGSTYGSRFDRRRFLALAAGAAAVGGAGYAALQRGNTLDALGPLPTNPTSTAPATTTSSTVPPPASTTEPPPTTTLPAPADSILVVVQMGGGNDGLNTLVPEAGFYRDARPTLAIPEADRVALAGYSDARLHPAMAPLASYWADGQMAFVHGLGLPGQSRSHFQAMDHWWAGHPDPPVGTGWLGRWLDAAIADDNPFAGLGLAFGSPALQGRRRLTTSVLAPQQMLLSRVGPVAAERVAQAYREIGGAEPTGRGFRAAYRATMAPAIEATDAFEILAPDLTDFNGQRRRTVSEALEAAAGVIELDLGTRVVVVGAGGFDTHANQANMQAELLTDVAEGIDLFLQRMAEVGRAEQVMVMTTSEFGRRIPQNASAGSDHGDGGTQWIVAPGLASTWGTGRMVGEVRPNPADRENVLVDIDTRSLYA